jgi:hypothetical protein
MTISRTSAMRWSARLAAAALASIALGACVVAPAPGYYGGEGYEPGPYVTVEPPAPRAEVIGVAPYPGYFWIGGYWGWVGGRHEWVPGRWEAPRAGYRYVPHAWVREGGGWRMHPGHWEGERR